MSMINQTLSNRTETKPCPQCQKQIPVSTEYITWCEYCDYNVNPTLTEESDAITRLYERLGDRLGESMVESIKEGVVPSARFPTFAAFLIATIIHITSLSLFIGALYCLFFVEKSILVYIMTVLLFGLSWVLRPRINRLEKDEVVISREDYPTLYKICDKISEEMNTKKVDGIGVSHHFNASITEIGLRRKVVVTIGLPLFAILDPDERLSILAHEFGHKDNKDLSKGLYIGTAINTLINWFELLYPDTPGTGERDDGLSLLEVPTYYFMKGLSFIPYSLLYVLTFLLFRNKQVAEFRADLFGAEVVGSNTAIRALEKLHYDDLYGYISRKVALAKDKRNLFEELRTRIESLPERERKRLKRKTELEKTRIESTHPPTHLRLSLLKGKTMHPRLTLTSAEMTSFQKELERLEGPIQERIIDEIKYELYQ